MPECIRCGRGLESDEVGLHKKLVSRAATEYMCISCLSEEFEVSESRLREKIEEFREAGCTLFISRKP